MFCWLISLNKQNHLAHDGVHAQQSLFPNRGGIGMRLFTPEAVPNDWGRRPLFLSTIN